MRVLCIDGMNLLHRARSGFREGEHFVCFNFLRSLRSLVEKHGATRVYMAMEGSPRHRFGIDAAYKANRRIEPIGKDSTPEEIARAEELASFFRQVDEVLHVMRHLPVSVVRHPEFEADDVIYNLIARSSTAVPWTVVSTDSDFIQLLDEFSHVSLYNPVTRTHVAAPDYDYVVWKSLRGDPSDNVPPVPGMTDRRAAAVASDPEALAALCCDGNAATRFASNYGLIKFAAWSSSDAEGMSSSSPTRDWAAVSRSLEGWGFRSMLAEPAWSRFVTTFEQLWS